MYRTLGQQAEYARQSGFDRMQQEQMVVSLAKQQGALARSDVIKRCRISDDQATRLLQNLVASGKLVARGLQRWRRCYLPGGSS